MLAVKACWIFIWVYDGVGSSGWDSQVVSRVLFETDEGLTAAVRSVQPNVMYFVMAFAYAYVLWLGFPALPLPATSLPSYLGLRPNLASPLLLSCPRDPITLFLTLFTTQTMHRTRRRA